MEATAENAVLKDPSQDEKNLETDLYFAPRSSTDFMLKLIAA